ncbi:hypothetical protein BMETH_951_0 [methanotrophic bacterial endosymbiont of Bathymodiolus sp.]|nr:hypothetical protein BMETH_951_0 [methanotrophic bacterial endosymbiont of Bathymodiolus sp.]
MAVALYLFWCLGPESNRHAQKARDFKSLASTNFATEASISDREQTIIMFFSSLTSKFLFY